MAQQTINLLPDNHAVTSDPYVSRNISDNLNTFAFKSVIFRDAAGAIAQATAGTVTIEATEHNPIDGKWKSIPSGSFPAADADTQATPPNLFGNAKNVRVTFTGVLPNTLTAELSVNGYSI